MSWLIAFAYVLALALLGLGLAGRADARLTRLLGSVGPPQTSRRISEALRRIGAAARHRVRLGRELTGTRAAVPDLLDLLAVSVTAGLSPRLALERAPDLLDGALGEVLLTVRRDVALGSSWHVALEDAATSAGVAELRRLAITLRRAERLGAPLAERLRELASQVRNERRAQREERARRAPVQMLFPLVFLILPAFVVAAVVPALIVATRDIV